MKIAYLTSVHPRNDTRVDKMCQTSLKFSEVFLICADGFGNSKKKNFTIYDLGVPKNRLSRVWTVCNQIYKTARNINADIYHIHDPELIRIGLNLIKDGKKVIFDSHEYIIPQLLDKVYLNFLIKYLIVIFYFFYQSIALNKFTALIAATKRISKDLKKFNSNVTVIFNYPTINKNFSSKPVVSQKKKICYIGDISTNRGIVNLVKSLEFVKNDITLELAGKFDSKELLVRLKKIPSWKKVNYLGYVDHNVFFNSTNYQAGMLNLLRTRNHNESLPNKLFEYMKYGIPIIYSNFYFWNRIIKKNNCGVPCNQNNPQDIANKIDYIINNPIKAKKMSMNGFKAFKKYYNWCSEEKKLFKLYKKI